MGEDSEWKMNSVKKFQVVPEKPDYVNAEFIYHGDDGMGDSDWWELTLCTDMEMVSTSTPVAGTGPGQAI